jgi:hypothetical protein
VQSRKNKRENFVKTLDKAVEKHYIAACPEIALQYILK